MSSAGLLKIKPPPITIPPPPPAPSIPAFDYIVDIYSDKVVVTDASGNTTQLSSILELNNWLSNITGKKIRINVNVEVYDNLMLTPNEYWFFGEWIHGNIYLHGKNITIVSFTRLGDASHNSYVTNYDPQTRVYVDVSGLKLYSVYADINIRGKGDMILRDVLIHVEMTHISFVEYIEGDLYMRGGLINIMRSTLHNAYVDSDFMWLEDIVSRDYLGAWVMVTRELVHITGTVDARYTLSALLHLRNLEIVHVDARSSVTIVLPTIDYHFIYYRVVLAGVIKGSNPYYIDPLPPGVMYQFNVENKSIVINNATDTGYNIALMYEITTGLLAG